MIPDELATLAGERRIIPFLGAGFSDSLGLPSWDSMLRKLCARTEGSLSFDELYQATEGNYLQIAEYLYLKSDKRIGPLRRNIDRALVPNGPVMRSAPHVELINLGAQQIYTTNYDDLIESSYRALKFPIDVIALPKDIAVADPKRTQIVKYHGDLEHEETLVLTESDYYKRLDFDSPMDLKFRSDLLGKSVLFMGYSFRDINIRVIWFKLMDMIRDIPEADRRPSYIVRLNANPALEELYSAVGIRTIVLSPQREVVNPAERAELLGDFLLRLSLKAKTRPVSPQNSHASSKIVVSSALLARPDELAGATRLSPSETSLWRYGGYIPIDAPRVARLLRGRVPKELRDDHQDAIARVLPVLDLKSASALLRVARKATSSPSLTGQFVRHLASQGGTPPREVRSQLIARFEDWGKIWSAPLTKEHARIVLDSVESELYYQATQGADEDGAYLADLGCRLANGTLTDVPDLVQRAKAVMSAAVDIYASIADLHPPMDGPPHVDQLLLEIRSRAADFHPVQWSMTRGGRKLNVTTSAGLRRSAIGTESVRRIRRPPQVAENVNQSDGGGTTQA